MFFHLTFPREVFYVAALYIGARAFIRVLFEVRRALRVRTDRRAANWPRTSAMVQSSNEFFELLPGKKAAHSTSLQYVYEVNGDFYSGTYWLPGFRSKHYMAEERGKDWLEKRISVRYNPEKPQESTFLVKDGAPGRPYVPRALYRKRDMILLHLK